MPRGKVVELFPGARTELKEDTWRKVVRDQVERAERGKVDGQRAWAVEVGRVKSLVGLWPSRFHAEAWIDMQREAGNTEEMVPKEIGIVCRWF